MATDVEVPAVGESVTEAILLKWHKQDGDHVNVDEPLCELETDKANVDVPAPASGIVKRVAAEGDTVEVGAVIATLAEGQSPPPPTPSASSTSSAPAPTPAATPAPAPAPATGSVDPAETMSPAVRNLIDQHGLDPHAIPATGRDGRLLKEDVQRYLDGRGASAPAAAPASAPAPAAPAPAVAPSAPASAAAPRAASDQGAASPPSPPPISRSPRSSMRETREPMSKLRRRIAERLVAAQQETAMLTTFNEIDLGEVKALRAKYKESFKDRHGVGLGFMSFFTKATAMALMEFPAVNAFIDGDDLVFHDYVNMGIAVSTPRGLVVPVVQDVLSLSLWEIESEIKRVALAARDGKLGLKEMTGGTFTITNGGVFGSMMSTPILNRPQSGILGMHNIVDRPVALDGQVVVRPMMYVALSYDHRIIDGKESVGFLVRIKQLLEDPARMLLEI